MPVALVRLLEDGNKVVWINPQEIAAIHELPQTKHEPTKCQVNMTSGACFRFVGTPDAIACQLQAELTLTSSGDG